MLNHDRLLANPLKLGKLLESKMRIEDTLGRLKRINV
jgi:hypothetical protein